MDLMDKRRTRNPERDADEAAAEDAVAESPVSESETATGPAATAEEDGSRASGPLAAEPTVAAADALREVEAEREKYLRLAAEFDNYRKRAVRERQEAGWRAQSELVMGLIDVMDDIMRFAHLDPATVDSATVVQGVAIVEKKLLKTLGGHGLEVIHPVDQPFDPAFHEAVGTEAALSREDDHLIAKVYQAGYVFRGQLLRPARVVVKQWLG
jgi:molecular chaperone GrpE